MSNIPAFNGTQDVVGWASMVRSKLISKGYKHQLLNASRPDVAGQAQIAWDALADKATGMIQTYMDPNITMQFENKGTPQDLFEAVVSRYCPDQRQEIERLESELNNLTYDGTDPVKWVAMVRALVVKLTTKQAPPQERTVKNLVLNALEQGEPEYKIRVEMIRYSQPDITLENLWLAVGRLPYPIKTEESLLVATEKLTLTSREKGNRLKGGGRDYTPYVPRSRPRNDGREQRKCFKCNQKGHLAYQCPEEKDTSDDSEVSSEDEEEKQKSKRREKQQPHHYTFLAQEVQEKAKTSPKKETPSARVEVEFARLYFKD